MIRASAVIALLLLCSCSNPCEDLADKVCDRAGEDLAQCASVASESDGDACARMKGVVASCKSLMVKAPEADRDDQAACKADLELIRALERAQN